MSRSGAETVIHAQEALLPRGWVPNVRLTLSDGAIAAVETDQPAQPGDARHDVLLPAMPNLHSHAFQRAMAGLAEMRGPGADSFWSWRTVMYRFALSMSPEDVEAVAAQLYMEMLEAGFGRVGEFHYLHNAPDGSPYADIAEMAVRIGAAARESGIRLTLMPVFYAHSGFGGQAPIAGQRRFLHSLDSYGRLMERAGQIVGQLPGGVLGIAPHSLRAATEEEITAILPLAGDGPVHIHVAEQVKEVEDCLAFCGARPVERLLDRASVDARWCLIHATHMTADETRRLAASGAVAGLCPITEANLGDGIFPMPDFREAGGRYGIGSDSNVRISLGEELRMLEYSQRLGLRARNVIAQPGGSTGRQLFNEALTGGGAALGAPAGLAPGAPADLVALAKGEAAHLSGDALLDHFIFAGGVPIDTVWIGGTPVVENGRHRARAAISARFQRTMARLMEA